MVKNKKEEHQELREEIRTINRQAKKAGRPSDIVNITGRAIRDRMRVRERGQLEGLTKKAVKQVAGRKGAEKLFRDLKPEGSLLDILLGN